MTKNELKLFADILDNVFWEEANQEDVLNVYPDLQELHMRVPFEEAENVIAEGYDRLSESLHQLLNLVNALSRMNEGEFKEWQQEMTQNLI